jgi:hypothetical protein
MSWIVLTAPAATEKFVLLYDAIPFAAVVASLMVTLAPDPDELFRVKAPVRPFSDVTPLPLSPQVGQLMLPLASIASGPLALTTSVPFALGRVIDLFDPAGVAKTSELVKPPDVAVKLVEALPCRSKLCVVEPTLIAPLGVIVLTVRVPPTERVPVKLAAFEIVCPFMEPVVVKPPNVGVAAVSIF